MHTTQTELHGKRVLVTGGTTGIGRATVKALVGDGARVVTLGRHMPELEASISEARAPGTGEAWGLQADTATRDGIHHAFAAVEERLGGLDVLVCCAAVGAEPLAEMGDEDWRYVIETNLVGYMACARKAIAIMSPAGGGHLLFVGSISSTIKAAGESVYAASKAGVDAFAETLRKEISEDRNIRITVIQPGAAATEMQESSDEQKAAAVSNQEMLLAEDVAEAILFALTRPERSDIVTLRIEPRIQKTS
jgi:3-hydroxy acid dehydrogenase/malonic semialdehyde reductase